MQSPLELSDAEFMKWAGARPQRWAVLPGERREAWLEHLIARIRSAADDDERNECWKLAYAIAYADAHGAPAID